MNELCIDVRQTGPGNFNGKSFEVNPALFLDTTAPAVPPSGVLQYGYSFQYPTTNGTYPISLIPGTAVNNNIVSASIRRINGSRFELCFKFILGADTDSFLSGTGISNLNYLLQDNVNNPSILTSSVPSVYNSAQIARTLITCRDTTSTVLDDYAFADHAVAAEFYNESTQFSNFNYEMEFNGDVINCLCANRRTKLTFSVDFNGLPSQDYQVSIHCENPTNATNFVNDTNYSAIDVVGSAPSQICPEVPTSGFLGTTDSLANFGGNTWTGCVDINNGLTEGVNYRIVVVVEDQAGQQSSFISAPIQAKRCFLPIPNTVIEANLTNYITSFGECINAAPKERIKACFNLPIADINTEFQDAGYTGSFSDLTLAIIKLYDGTTEVGNFSTLNNSVEISNDGTTYEICTTFRILADWIGKKIVPRLCLLFNMDGTQLTIEKDICINVGQLDTSIITSCRVINDLTTNEELTVICAEEEQELMVVFNKADADDFCTTAILFEEGSDILFEYNDQPGNLPQLQDSHITGIGPFLPSGIAAIGIDDTQLTPGVTYCLCIVLHRKWTNTEPDPTVCVDTETYTKRLCLPLRRSCATFSPDGLLANCDETHNCTLCEEKERYFAPFICEDKISLQTTFLDSVNSDPMCPTVGWKDSNSSEYYMQLELCLPTGNIPIDIDEISDNYYVGYQNGISYQQFEIDFQKVCDLGHDCFSLEIKSYRFEDRNPVEVDSVCTQTFKKDDWNKTIWLESVAGCNACIDDVYDPIEIPSKVDCQTVTGAIYNANLNETVMVLDAPNTGLEVGDTITVDGVELTITQVNTGTQNNVINVEGNHEGLTGIITKIAIEYGYQHYDSIRLHACLNECQTGAVNVEDDGATFSEVINLQLLRPIPPYMKKILFKRILSAEEFIVDGEIFERNSFSWSNNFNGRMLLTSIPLTKSCELDKNCAC